MYLEPGHDLYFVPPTTLNYGLLVSKQRSNGFQVGGPSGSRVWPLMCRPVTGTLCRPGCSVTRRSAMDVMDPDVIHLPYRIRGPSSLKGSNPAVNYGVTGAPVPKPLFWPSVRILGVEQIQQVAHPDAPFTARLVPQNHRDWFGSRPLHMRVRPLHMRGQERLGKRK